MEPRHTRNSNRSAICPVHLSGTDPLALRYDSPLLEAITAGRPVNVRLLLEAGADPNDLCIGMLSRYSAQYLRFRQLKGTLRVTRPSN